MRRIEREVAAEKGTLPAPAAAPTIVVSRKFSSLLTRQMLPRLFVG